MPPPGSGPVLSVNLVEQIQCTMLLSFLINLAVSSGQVLLPYKRMLCTVLQHAMSSSSYSNAMVS